MRKLVLLLGLIVNKCAQRIHGFGQAGGGRGTGVEPSPRAPSYPEGPGRTWFVSGGSGRPWQPGPMDQAQVPRPGRILAGHTDAASAPTLSLGRAAGTPSHQALR
jgi:hypothetical protein